MPGEDLFWPTTLLAKDIPDARIITWGHPIKDSRKESDKETKFGDTEEQKQVIQQCTEKLVKDIDDTRQEKGLFKRPIILVGHSVGGTIIARVGASSNLRFIYTEYYMQAMFNASVADLDPIYHVTDYIHGVAFMGSPLSDEGAMRISKWLADHSAKGICFQEEFVAEKDLFVQMPRIPGRKFVHLHANHDQMTKFCDPDCANYVRVRDTLQQWVEELRTPEAFS